MARRGVGDAEATAWRLQAGNTWSVVIDHGRDPDTGKRKQVWHSGFATLSEASEARTRLLRERDTGAAIDPSRHTFAEFIRDEWLPSRAPTTGRAGRGHRGKGRHPDVGLVPR